MVKNWRFARLCCTPHLVSLSVSLSLFLSLTPFILRVPLDPAEAGPQQLTIGMYSWGWGGEWLLKVLYLTLIWLFMFLINLTEFFFWITVPYQMYNVQIPFSTSRFPFSFFPGFLHCRVFFLLLFDVVLFIFTFIFLAWGNISPPNIFKTEVKVSLPIFYSVIFNVLDFTFKSLTYVEFIFVYNMIEWFSCILFPEVVQFRKYSSSFCDCYQWSSYSYF